MSKRENRIGLAESVRMAWEATDKAQLLVQCGACLVPIVVGIIEYDRLPESMAVHWGFGNEPNGWMPKSLVLFGIPVMMVLLQLVCVMTSEVAMVASRGNEKVTTNDVTGEDGSYRPQKLLLVAYWIIPVITVVLYAVTIAYNLGHDVPIGRVVLVLLALVLILCGNYSQKLPYSMAKVMTNPVPKDEQSYRHYARLCAYGMIALGFACLLGSFFV